MKMKPTKRGEQFQGVRRVISSQGYFWNAEIAQRVRKISGLRDESQESSFCASGLETRKILRRKEMRSSRSFKLFALIATLVALITSGAILFAQETTGGLQGTVRDASGAVIGGAHVIVRGSSMAGEKALDSESTGYYRFANLPPGVYSIEVSAKGFKTVKREGLTLEIGHLPTVDVTMEIGASSEVVEVSGQAPVIDVTTNTNQTNISTDVLNDVPHGRSFQSLIQMAPMARNEPLAGYIVNGGGNGGTGGSLPGSSGNGNTFGYSVGGAADSESSYLVEGQDTEQLSGGYSKANVPY